MFHTFEMGNQRRASHPDYTANGTLIAEDLPVRAVCRKCGAFKQVDLAAMAAKIGADLDLWNRLTPPPSRPLLSIGNVRLVARHYPIAWR